MGSRSLLRFDRDGARLSCALLDLQPQWKAYMQLLGKLMAPKGVDVSFHTCEVTAELEAGMVQGNNKGMAELVQAADLLDFSYVCNETSLRLADHADARRVVALVVIVACARLKPSAAALPMRFWATRWWIACPSRLTGPAPSTSRAADMVPLGADGLVEVGVLRYPGSPRPSASALGRPPLVPSRLGPGPYRPGAPSAPGRGCRSRAA